jgi:MYXO-CTERM domain-containing protein
MLIMDGPWPNPQGQPELRPAQREPEPQRRRPVHRGGVPTYVVAFGDGPRRGLPRRPRPAGGTTGPPRRHPRPSATPSRPSSSTSRPTWSLPVCAPGVPRIMLLLDASSSMLNINGGTQHAPPGHGRLGPDPRRPRWRRLALRHRPRQQQQGRGPGPPRHRRVRPQQPRGAEGGRPVRPLPQGQHRLGPRPRLLLRAPPAASTPTAPRRSSGPSTTARSRIRPNFDEKTLSHMPKCDFAAQNPNACVGSGTFTHLGLNLIHDNLAHPPRRVQQARGPLPVQRRHPVPQHPHHRRQVQLVRRPGPAAAHRDVHGRHHHPRDRLRRRGRRRTSSTRWRSGLGQHQGLLQDADNQDPAGDVPQEHHRAADLRRVLLVQRLRDDPRAQHRSSPIRWSIPDPSTQQQRRARHTESGTTSRRDEPRRHRPVHHQPSTRPTAHDPNDRRPATSPTRRRPTTDGGTSNTAGETTSSRPRTATPTAPRPRPATTSPPASSRGLHRRRRRATGVDDEGCGCKVDDSNNTRGLLGTLFTLGMAGFIRRRRRA